MLGKIDINLSQKCVSGIERVSKEKQIVNSLLYYFLFSITCFITCISILFIGWVSLLLQVLD